VNAHATESLRAMGIFMCHVTLPEVSLGERFYTGRKCGTREVGFTHRVAIHGCVWS